MSFLQLASNENCERVAPFLCGFSIRDPNCANVFLLKKTVLFLRYMEWFYGTSAVTHEKPLWRSWQILATRCGSSTTDRYNFNVFPIPVANSWNTVKRSWKALGLHASTYKCVARSPSAGMTSFRNRKKFMNVFVVPALRGRDYEEVVGRAFVERIFNAAVEYMYNPSSHHGVACYKSTIRLL